MSGCRKPFDPFISHFRMLRPMPLLPLCCRFIQRVKSPFDSCSFFTLYKEVFTRANQGPDRNFQQDSPYGALNRHKKAPSTLSWWSFLEKPYVGIEGPSEIGSAPVE